MAAQTVAAKRIPYVYTNFGSDPEFFFAKKTKFGKRGAIVGAEKIIPEKGMRIPNMAVTTKPSIVIDGVQAELNPRAYTCRQACAREIASNFKVIADVIKKKGVTINWNPTVRVTKKEMYSLSPKSRMFGCEPSFNAYGEKIEQPDASIYPFRSAGGHIHIGYLYEQGPDQARDILKQKDPSAFVKLLDIVVGNTFVLLDRHEGNIERRKAYGRAGEYRKPKHGIEYRVLSNFWLQNYVLMSLAFGLVRLAISIAAEPTAFKAFMEANKEDDIRKAINENDYDLAMKNFKNIVPLIKKFSTESHSLHAGNLEEFDHFVCKGAKRWFKGDPMKDWTDPKFNAAGGTGWESFVQSVRFDMAVCKK